MEIEDYSKGARLRVFFILCLASTLNNNSQIEFLESIETINSRLYALANCKINENTKYCYPIYKTLIPELKEDGITFYHNEEDINFGNITYIISNNIDEIVNGEKFIRIKNSLTPQEIENVISVVNDYYMLYHLHDTPIKKM